MGRNKKSKPIEKSTYVLNLREVIDRQGEDLGDAEELEILSSYEVHPKAKKDVEEYFDLEKEPNIITRFFRKVFHISWWAIRLVLPAFLVGHPSLFDNLKTLWKNPQFKPLRMLGVAWIIFSVVVGSTALYSMQKASKAHAQNDFSIKTGYYMGTGSALSITGVGFAPQAVIVKAESTAGSMILKTSAMPASVVTYPAVATADNTETEITLDSDGFSVSVAAEVNSANVRYTYIAFAGSDCTSNGTMCIGAYTGNTASSQIISTGFQPDVVLVKRTTAVVGNFRTSSMSTNHAAFFSAAANDTTGVYFQTLNSDGFTVGATNNTSGGVFYYMAFKNITGKLAVGQFTGDGVDNKEITGLGFEPDFVLVKQNSAVVPAFSTTETWGDNSQFSTAAAPTVNNIQDLTADGFQVGNGTSVNVLGITSYYFAFGGIADPSPSGSFFMQRGSYVGSGVARSIDTSFAPDLVIIKANSTEHGVFSISIVKDLTQYMAVATAGFTGGITAMTSSGFSVGTHSTVNTNGVTYEYVAFGNATSPQKAVGAADFLIGAYTGNGSTTRAIDHLGVAPSMVVIKRHTGTAALTNWNSSTMSANTSEHFSATADVTDGTMARTLDSGGFTVGSAATVNAAATPYIWFAFKEGSYFDVGSYSGNGVAGTNNTAPGFSPGYVWVKRSTAVQAANRSSSATITGANSQYFTNVANAANMLTALTSTGFTLGSGTEVNANAGAYQFAAWKSSTSSNAPSTPTNSTPANAATAQNLNPVLSGSAYSDLDSNTQVNAQWQVDDDSDFATPVWSRTAGSAEFSTTVNTSNGTFANELAGETELDHNSTYYWRVRYSDGVWSSWSTGTNFTTNIIETPTNTSPASAATVTTLTPTLTASAFSDAQTGHTAANAQWQLDATNSFTSPIYDSGTTGYSASFAVPSAVLSNLSSYYWRVRYQDSSGMWSSYSSPTRFLVSESPLSVRPLFGSNTVDQGDSVRIDAEIKLLDGSVVNDATAILNVYDSSSVKIVDAASMSYITGSSGLYRYSYVIPSVSGTYLYEVIATQGAKTGYGAANFEVRTTGTDIQDLQDDVQDVHDSVDNVQNDVNDANTGIQGVQTDVDDLQTKVGDIQTKTNTLVSNLDILVGALIVTQSSINDTTPSSSLFITNLSNATDNFYKNAVLTFTSGALDGQSRRVSAYTGATKAVRLDPALTSAPANGDTFTVVSQNVRIEEQAADIASTTADTNSKVSDIQTKVNSIQSTLNHVDTGLDALQTTVDSIRTSQQLAYTVHLSGSQEVQSGTKYRAKLSVEDYQSEPHNASSTPTITVYDSSRVVVVTAASMTRTSEGVYEYNYTVPSGSTAGLWESVVTVPINGSSQTKTHYWTVTGSPAQVVINRMSSLTVPTISADVTITNEGNSEYEYQYQWCVVEDEIDQCGDPDVVAGASAAKLIQEGEDFTPTLSLTVPHPGNYWFKLKVFFGNESSAASRNFIAIDGDNTIPPDTDSSDDSSGGSNSRTTTLATVRKQLEVNTAQIQKMLGILGNIDPNAPGFRSLLTINEENTTTVKDVQNKIADLKAISAAIHHLSDQKSTEPIVETYMKFNSVELHFLITNPHTKQQTVSFKAPLPDEVKPETIMNSDGLKVEYDANAKTYFVSGQILLGAGESVTKKVEMKDIWIFTPAALADVTKQTDTLVKVLEKTQYSAQATLLQNEISSAISNIQTSQTASYDTPQNHIVVYRENKAKMAEVINNISKMKELVSESGVSKGLLGNIGGIQAFSTWGIILAMIFGFTLMAAIIFSMWRNQMMLTAMAMKINKGQIQESFAKKPLKKTVPKKRMAIYD